MGMKAQQVDEESLLKQIDMSGLKKWSKEDHEAARLLIKEFSYVFFWEMIYIYGKQQL